MNRKSKSIISILVILLMTSMYFNVKSDKSLYTLEISVSNQILDNQRDVIDSIESSKDMQSYLSIMNVLDNLERNIYEQDVILSEPILHISRRIPSWSAISGHYTFYKYDDEYFVIKGEEFINQKVYKLSTDDVELFNEYIN